jgi:hypothetical protein
MKHHTDIYALAKDILRATTTAPPICFVESQSLADDLATALTRRKEAPAMYAGLRRLLRDRIEARLRHTETCGVLLPVAVKAAPLQMWRWPATGSDSPRLHGRLAAFLLPLVLQQVLGALVGLSARDLLCGDCAVNRTNSHGDE